MNQRQRRRWEWTSKFKFVKTKFCFRFFSSIAEFMELFTTLEWIIITTMWLGIHFHEIADVPPNTIYTQIHRDIYYECKKINNKTRLNKPVALPSSRPRLKVLSSSLSRREWKWRMKNRNITVECDQTAADNEDWCAEPVSLHIFVLTRENKYEYE